MIVGTTNHPKFIELAIAMDLMPCFVAGILECLWNFTREFCPQGNIGRFSDQAIARGIGYEGDAVTLMQALVDSKWLDNSEEYRLIIHDWPEHCGMSVHGKLARERKLFACGASPDPKSLFSSERKDYSDWLASLTKQDTHVLPTNGSVGTHKNLVVSSVSPRVSPHAANAAASRAHESPPPAAASPPQPDHARIAEVLHRATPRQRNPPGADIVQQIAKIMGNATVEDLEAWIAERARNSGTEPRKYIFWVKVIAQDFKIPHPASNSPPCATCHGAKTIYGETCTDATLAELDAAKKPCPNCTQGIP